MTSRRFAPLVSCVLGLVLTACEPTDRLSAPSATGLTASSGPRLIQCPTNETSTAAGLVTSLGGLVALDGHSVQVPGGALLAPTTLTITEPASNNVVLRIQANGAQHFQFETPVLVTISYARCTRNSIDRGALQVWYIDEETGELLENMGGFDDKLLRTVSFWTSHLSGYAIAE